MDDNIKLSKMKTALDLKNDFVSDLLNKIVAEQDSQNMSLEQREAFSVEVLDRLSATIENWKNSIHKQQMDRFWDGTNKTA